MNKFWLLLSFVVIASCDNMLDLVEDYKDIPIVYGLLSSTDTAQYFRVEKAFLSSNTSALEIAQNPDSLYYDNATVSIVRSSTGEEFVLHRVDGNTEGYVRDQGVFAQAPNYLYKIHTTDLNLQDEVNYEFRLKRDETSPLVTVDATLVGPPTLRRPTENGTLGFVYQGDTEFSWLSSPSGKVFDVTVKINYSEIKDAVLVDKSLYWKVATNVEEKEVFVNGVNFYSFMASSLNEDPNIIRVLKNADVILDSGGIDVLRYVQVGQANLGITSSQDIPIYSNLSEGRGLFSSKHRFVKPGIPFTELTQDSLSNGIFTKHLNF